MATLIIGEVLDRLSLVERDSDDTMIRYAASAAWSELFKAEGWDDLAALCEPNVSFAAVKSLRRSLVESGRAARELDLMTVPQLVEAVRRIENATGTCGSCRD